MCCGAVAICRRSKYLEGKTHEHTATSNKKFHAVIQTSEMKNHLIHSIFFFIFRNFMQNSNWDELEDVYSVMM